MATVTDDDHPGDSYIDLATGAATQVVNAIGGSALRSIAIYIR